MILPGTDICVRTSVLTVALVAVQQQWLFT